ncbi:MAG: sugar phosphate isomerase/epimerase family protein [bacterium]
MRLGGHCYTASNTAELELLCEKLDAHGLSAITAPWKLAEWTADQAAAHGERARQLGLEIGEVGMWGNLLTDNVELRQQRISQTRALLRNADAMGCHCVVTLVGSKHPGDSPLSMHCDNYGDVCQREFREIVLRILDGLELRRTKYVIEPWHNTFFYQPEEIRAFLDSVGHPAFGLHLDQMNLVSQTNFFRTTELINTTFDLLAEKVFAVHLKDIQHDPGHMFLKWDEVRIGEGVMDYDTYLKRLAKLPADTPCFCEHFSSEADYIASFATLHKLAEKVGTKFLRRHAASNG